MPDPAVPWNAAWTGEDGAFEIRPCRYAQGQLAVWQPHRPGEGRPMFAEPHMVRQRRSIAEMLCTVCGEPTKAGQRWWFQHGQNVEEWFMTTEAPVHRRCADHALAVCPHLRRQGIPPLPFPEGAQKMAATVKPDALFELFGLKRKALVIGQIKLAWPRSRIRYQDA